MIYTARIKVTCKSDPSFVSDLAYVFVNQTKNKVSATEKLDQNGCSKVYECDKRDIVYVELKKKGALIKKVSVPVLLKGSYNQSQYDLKITNAVSQPAQNNTVLLSIKPVYKFLIYVIQGYGVEPAAGKEELPDTAKDKQLGSLTLFRNQFTQVKVFNSTTTDRTIDVIASDILKNRKANNAAKVIVVGHSQGADNTITLGKKYNNIIFDLFITLDISDISGVDTPLGHLPGVGGIEDDNVGDNVLNIINYYQEGEFLQGEVVDRDIFFPKTKLSNILSVGSNHRSIDNDLIPYIIEDIKSFMSGEDAVKKAGKRKLPKFNPSDSGSQNISS